MLTPKDYEGAVLVQDACNLSGVVYAWAEVMKKVCAEAYANKKGTDWKNSHPINMLYASKVASLTGCVQFSRGAPSFHDAYETCRREGNL